MALFIDNEGVNLSIYLFIRQTTIDSRRVFPIGIATYHLTIVLSDVKIASLEWWFSWLANTAAQM